MSTLSAWKARVVERSVARAAASLADRRTPEAIARRALRPTTRIVQAALELAEESREASFTVQDVIERADVSLQTFYRHFQSKDELLLAVLEEAITERTIEWRQATARLRDPIARVEFIVTAPFTREHNQSRLYPMIVQEHLRLMQRYAVEVRAFSESYRELLAEAIRDVQSTGRFLGVDAAEEAEMIEALVLARYHNLVLGALTDSPGIERKRLWVFCLAGLSRNELAPASARRAPSNGPI